MLSIPITDTRHFMAHLLSKDSFHKFYLVEASVKMGVSYHIDGHLNRAFYDSDTKEVLTREFCYWQEIQSHVFSIIRGKRLPLSLKIVLALPKASVAYLTAHSGSSLRSEEVEGLYLNILYDPEKLIVTTGISCRVFSLDRSLEHAFDDYIAGFLKSKGIC